MPKKQGKVLQKTRSIFCARTKCTNSPMAFISHDQLPRSGFPWQSQLCPSRGDTSIIDDFPRSQQRERLKSRKECCRVGPMIIPSIAIWQKHFMFLMLFLYWFISTTLGGKPSYNITFICPNVKAEIAHLYYCYVDVSWFQRQTIEKYDSKLYQPQEINEVSRLFKSRCVR